MKSASIVRLGAFVFRYRNMLGPAVGVVAILLSRPAYPFGRPELDLAFDAAGVIIALAGQFLRIATIGYEYIVRGGRNRQVYADDLVQAGLFAHCRNPMYVGNILIAVGLALVINAVAFYAIVLPAILVAYISIAAAEESYLREKFGAQYEAYARRVNRWFPRPRGLCATLGGMRFNWRRVLVKEYSTTFILIAALACARLWSEYSVTGAAALPSRTVLVTGALAWIGLYLAVRALKKTGLVRG